MVTYNCSVCSRRLKSSGSLNALIGVDRCICGVCGSRVCDTNSCRTENSRYINLYINGIVFDFLRQESSDLTPNERRMKEIFDRMRENNKDAKIENLSRGQIEYFPKYYFEFQRVCKNCQADMDFLRIESGWTSDYIVDLHYNEKYVKWNTEERERRKIHCAEVCLAHIDLMGYERAGNYEAAAKILEDNSLPELAKEMREKGKVTKNINVDLNRLIEDLRTSGLAVKYKCPGCGAPMSVEPHNGNLPKVCQYCGAALNTDAIVDVIKAALK